MTIDLATITIVDTGPRQKNGWLPAHDAMLRDNFEKGLPLSYSEMAEIINGAYGTSYTRNSAIGRANRLKLIAPKKVKNINRKPGSDKIKRKPKATPAQKRGLRVGPTLSGPQQPPAPAQLRCDPLKAGTFHVTELEEGMCRYPTGDREILFCGSPQVVGRAYCADHLALTVQPARPSTRPSFRHRGRA